MIFTLFLGGYLLPKSQYRISEHRDYIIYQALCRNHTLEIIDTNIAMIVSTLSMVTEQKDLDVKIKAVNDLLKRKQIIKAQDFYGLQSIDEAQKDMINKGFTGDTSIDKLLRLHKLLSKYNIIRE